MRLRLLLALLISASLAACEGRTPRLARLAEADVVVAFGDSLTFGTGANPEESYPVVLAGLIGRPVVRAGVPGELTAGGLARLPLVLDQHQPKLVIVCLGGNDMLRKSSMATAESNLRAILYELKSRHIDAVLVGVPQPALLAGAPAFFETLAREFNVPYDGKIVGRILYKAEFKSDTVHPNAAGYHRMAEAIAALLRDAGAL